MNLSGDPPSAASAPCVLLTATVHVAQDMAFTARRDTTTRYFDYREALTRWLAVPGQFSIVFVENSGYDLAELQALAARAGDRQVEFLSFISPPFDGALGKGYGEMLCLRHALEHSSLLQRAPCFLKVTGRYWLANAPAMLAAVAARPDAAVFCNLLEDLTWADSRVFGGSPEFLRNYLCPLQEQLNDSLGVPFEKVLARAMHRLMAEGGVWALPPVPPQVKGVSGSLGRPWVRTPLQELKQRVRLRLLTYLLGIHPE